MIDLKQVRADTPNCEHVLHFNSAGASLMPAPVYDSMQAVLRDEYEVGGYEAERRAQPDIKAFYDEFAALLNAQPDEIAYVENATRAWDMAFYGLNLKPGDRVITHGSEYASNYLALLQQSRRLGFEIDAVPSDTHGQIDVAALDKMVTARTKLIAITHVPTQGGLVNPAEAVGAVARKHGVLYLLDACQSVGQINLDVQAIGCDFLSGTGRKFLRGPRGTGFLYVKRAALDQIDPPFIDLHSATWTDADDYRFIDGTRRFENWESFVAGRVGLTAAVRYARSIGMHSIERRVAELGATLRTALSGIPNVSAHDLGQQKCGIVTFQKDGCDPALIADTLRAHRMNVSVTTVKNARLDLEPRNLPALVRASVHYFNSEDEIDQLVRAVHEL